MSATAPGPWRSGDVQVVEPTHVAAFASAVGESSHDMLAGRVVPTTYPVTLGWRLQNAAHDGVLPTDTLGLHGEHSFRFHAPVESGTTVVTRARLQSVVPRRSGTTVTTLSQTSSPDGKLLVEQLFTVFAVGQQLPASGEEVAPWPVVGEQDDLDVLAKTTEEVGADVPRRYSEAADDHYAIHLDDSFARRMGLPGVIVHGMCTLAYAARAVRHALPEGDGLTALGCRFHAPLLPGTQFTTTVRGGSAGVGLFETVAATGDTVISGRFQHELRQAGRR